MRVIGRPKPKGAMKVKGGRAASRPCRSPGPIPDRPMPAVHAIPKRGRLRRCLCARGESLSPAAPLAPWVVPLRSVVRGRGSPPLLACTQGGAGPGLAMRRRRANLLLALPALLGLSVGAPRVRAGLRTRPARGLRPPILLCPAWSSARAVGKYHEQTCWDPKDGELCLARMKSGETLMEVRSGSDVQIDHRSWV